MESTPSNGMMSYSNSNSKKWLLKRNSDFKGVQLSAILQKADTHAHSYGGKCMSNNGLSNCKGKNSIRFNCQNGHNFYLSEEKIRQADISRLNKNWKRARRDLKSYMLSKQRDEPCLVPVNSINYCDDSWCNKCYEYFNQASKIAF